MEKKIFPCEKIDLTIKDDISKIEIFSVREIKSNPFALFQKKHSINDTLEDELKMDYKIELAMEYDLIYNSHYFDQ